MKCLIAGFLSVCVAVSLLMTGCSSGGTDNTAQTDGPVTITIWHDKEDEVAQALQTELDTLAPDIVVKLEKKDGLTDSLKMVGNDPNSAPDMYFFAHDKIGVYAEMGILAPITDFVDKSTLDQYIPMTIEAATYKGKVYQLPLYFETLLYMLHTAWKISHFCFEVIRRWWWMKRTSCPMLPARCTQKSCLKQIWTTCVCSCSRHTICIWNSACGRPFLRSPFLAGKISAD